MAALLSALWPGLGHLAEGARRTAILLALPPLILVVLGIGAIASPDRVSRLATLVNPDVIAALLVAEFLLLAWRLLAVGDAFRRGKGAARERGAALTAVALVFVLVPSAYAAYLTEVAREAALTVFAPAAQTYKPSAYTGGPRDDDFGTEPLPSTQPSPPPTLGRFTVLLLGVDSGAGRSEALTDTMIVASLDPIAGAVTMVSVPRDTVDVPLADGRLFHPKINSLVSYVNSYPSKFPGAPSGEAVLAAALGKLLNVHIDGWAEVNLPGFVRVIDSIGGVDVTVTDALCDYRYKEYGFTGFAINAGHYHLNGEAALAFARIRHSAGESDFTRAARQGEIVIAARDQIVHGGFLNDPAGLIESMGELVKTSLDPSVVAQYAGFAATIQRDHIYRAVIQYPLVHGAANDPRGSVLIPRMNLIQDLAKRAFPEAGTLPVGLDTIPEESTDPTKTKLPQLTCSAPPPPTATPTSKPTVAPSTGPTAPPPTPTDKPGGGPPTPEPTVPPPDPSP
ncbi:MAG: polyisoprenyl-teichoic acid--peptidoglycan teichoic acid transferase [Chloroflexota bacterium]|nr:polyisoprenyl-teichoic acid--peptidoglycan teichoic acid transferase [Chloroflexota bacterium]